MLPELILILFLVMCNAFFAAAEIALVSVRRTRVKQLVEEGDPRAVLVQQFLEHPTRFMATVQIGVTLLGFLASAIAAVDISVVLAKWLNDIGIMREAVAKPVSVVVVTVVLGLFTLVFGEIAPKSLAMQYSEKLALYFAGPLRVLSVLALPAVKIVSFLSDLVVRPFGVHVRFASPILSEEELKMLLEAGEEEGVIENEEKEMIHSIFDFTDTVARQVMVPRTDMDAVPVTSSLADLLEIITTTGHTRIPIYEENVDNIVGVVNAKDLLPILSNGVQDFDIRSVMREAYFIPETKDIDELLAEFRHGHIQMAIVRDEYGGTAGLVTVEDLIEEIVGEIRDEYDVEEPLIHSIDENRAIVSARMSVDDLNEHMHLDIPESEEYDTIAGFVFDLFGRQPQEGEVISWSNLDFVVTEVDSGRLQKIEVIRTDRQPDDDTSSGQSGNGKSNPSGQNGSNGRS